MVIDWKEIERQENMAVRKAASKRKQTSPVMINGGMAAANKTGGQVRENPLLMAINLRKANNPPTSPLFLKPEPLGAAIPWYKTKSSYATIYPEVYSPPANLPNSGSNPQDIPGGYDTSLAPNPTQEKMYFGGPATSLDYSPISVKPSLDEQISSQQAKNKTTQNAIDVAVRRPAMLGAKGRAHTAPSYDKEKVAELEAELENGRKIVSELIAQRNKEKGDYYHWLMAEDDFFKKSRPKEYAEDTALAPFSIFNPKLRENQAYEKYKYINNIGELKITEDEVNKIHGYLTADEKAIYNYIYATEGWEKATEFLRFLDDPQAVQNPLSMRRGVDLYSRTGEGNTALQILSGAGAGLDRAVSGFYQYFTEEPVNPGYIQYYGEMAREDLGDKGPEILGQSLGQIGYDIINTTGYMLPSLLVSKGFGMLGATSNAARIAGSAVMGTSSAGNAYTYAVGRGFSPGEARVYGTLVGASEGFLQYALGGIEGLSSGSVQKIAAKITALDNAFGRFAQTIAASPKLAATSKFVGNLFSEGMEEGLQEILEPVIGQMVLGTSAEINMENVYYAALLGMASAGTINAGSELAGLTTNAEKQAYFAGQRAAQKAAERSVVTSQSGTAGEGIDVAVNTKGKYDGYSDYGTDTSTRSDYTKVVDNAWGNKETSTIPQSSLPTAPFTQGNLEMGKSTEIASTGETGINYPYYTHNLQNRKGVDSPVVDAKSANIDSNAYNSSGESANPAPDKAAGAVPRMYVQDVKDSVSNNIKPQSAVTNNGVWGENLSSAGDTRILLGGIPWVGPKNAAGSGGHSMGTQSFANSGLTNAIGAGQGNKRTAIVPRRTIPRSPFVQYLEDIKNGMPNNIWPQSSERSSGENVFAEQGNPGYNGIIQAHAEANSGGQRGKRILLGGKLWSEAPDTGEQGRGLSEGTGGAKKPSELAKSWQGTGKYPGVDKYKDITLKQGKVVYRSEPNGTEYFTTKSAIEHSGNNATKIFEGLQVEKNPIHGYRGTMQGYKVVKDVDAAFGITKANPQFGQGGLPQVFIPDVNELIKQGVLVPVDSIPLIK